MLIQSRTEQRREEERRADKSRSQRHPLLVAEVGGIPDRPRAESLSHELIDEMELCNWIVDGKAVANPLGLLINRLKTDGAYKTKGKR